MTGDPRMGPRVRWGYLAGACAVCGRACHDEDETCSRECDRELDRRRDEEEAA